MCTRWLLGVFTLSLLIVSCTDQVLDPGAPQPPLIGPAFTVVGAVTDISTSPGHTCVIGSDGAISCSGNNEHGQSNPPSGSFTQVSTGPLHVCAVGTDSALKCWGTDESDWGQSNVPSGSFTHVSVGWLYACAVGTDGAIRCWGDNSLGQSGPPGGSFTQVAAGGGHTCAIDTPGVIRCWGDQTDAPSGRFTQLVAKFDDNCAIRVDGAPVCWGNDQDRHHLLEGSFAQVAAGEGHACALRRDGTVTCWRENWAGQLNAPHGSFTQMSAGKDFTCAVRPDAAVTCWGTNWAGQTNAPTGSFTQVSAGSVHACALGIDDTIRCWGTNSRGQLNAPSGSFTQVSAGPSETCAIGTDAAITCWGSGQSYAPSGSFTQVSVGESQSCAIGSGGAVTCWTVFGSSPRFTPPDGSFAQVSTGDAHTCAIRTDGSITCWGFEYDTPGGTAPPTGTFTQVSANGRWTCGIRTDTTIECWGDSKTTTFVSLRNDAPLVDGITLPQAPVRIGSAAAISASFTDSNVADVHTATIDWGDGTSSVGVVTEASGVGTVQGSHTYSQAGNFNVLVNVSDAELEGSRSSTNDVPAFIVVYDPNAGFVTGSGWIDSPLGACSWSGCAADGSTAGKATFGFGAKYQKRAATPTGTVRFEIAAGGLTFESRSYEWLVIADARAQLEGTGRINGAGDYAFQVSAVDGNASGRGGTDRFRIRIWERVTGSVVYDNEPGTPHGASPATEAGGGNIVLHTPKK